MKSLDIARRDRMAADTVPIAADLTVAVADDDAGAVNRILTGLTTEQLYALAVVLAAHVNVDLPMQITQARPTERVLEHAAKAFGVHPDDVRGGARHAEALDARKVTYYAAHLLGRSYSAIGRDMGRDHSTVMHGVSACGENARLRRIAVRIAERMGLEAAVAADEVAS